MTVLALHLDNVSHRYGAVTTVDHITLTVQPGQRLLLAGPNGAGKSTLLNLIDGTLRPTAGRIFYGGVDITTWPTRRRAAAGIARVFQQPQAAGRLSVRANILLAAHQHHRLGQHPLRLGRAVAGPLNEWADDLAEQTGLAGAADQAAGQLSYGHRRQLDLAIALACSPALLLIDEPTAGLSDTETTAITQLLKALPANLAYVLVEHDSAVADRTTSAAVHLRHGHAAEQAGVR